MNDDDIVTRLLAPSLAILFKPPDTNRISLDRYYCRVVHYPVCEKGVLTETGSNIWLDGQNVTGKRVVDYGCGSGILGIAAALKGAERVVCVDNDPQALEATTDNAARNGVTDRIQCLAPEAYSENSADFILANILAGPLVELAPVLLGSVKPGGAIVLCGILQEQAEMVIKAYREECQKICWLELDGWVRLTIQRVLLVH